MVVIKVDVENKSNNIKFQKNLKTPWKFKCDGKKNIQMDVVNEMNNVNYACEK